MDNAGFANILLSGPCNLACPLCIGSSLHSGARLNSLDRWPLPGLPPFAVALLQRGIREVSLTADNTEPMLYRHTPALLVWLRATLPGVRVSLHTNGTLILKRLERFNSFDRATISVPSLRPRTCLAMTGSGRVLDLEQIVSVAAIPLKVSTLVTRDNAAELPALMHRCSSLGIRRMVLRKPWQVAAQVPVLAGMVPARWFAGNPVFDVEGMEVTVWDFHKTSLPCVNLHADGTVDAHYELAGGGHG
jgi:MoaA/NifB/PqqE/SkfB family radical SAM enzyme